MKRDHKELRAIKLAIEKRREMLEESDDDKTPISQQAREAFRHPAFQGTALEAGRQGRRKA